MLGALTSTAALAGEEGTLDRGVRLLGAVWKRYPRGVFVHFAGSRARAQRCLDTARSALGEEAFSRAWAEGQAMSLEEAVEYALAGEGAAA